MFFYVAVLNNPCILLHNPTQCFHSHQRLLCSHNTSQFPKNSRSTAVTFIHCPSTPPPTSRLTNASHSLPHIYSQKPSLSLIPFHPASLAHFPQTTLHITRCYFYPVATSSKQTQPTISLKPHHGLLSSFYSRPLPFA